MPKPIDPESLEFGLNTFGELAQDQDRASSDAETVRLLIEEAQLAESVGLNSFSIGEHYREDYIDTAPAVLLGAVAQATNTIGVGTSVTVLSTQDPVRLYHEFSTVDAISSGRAQLVLGRASVLDSFELFGYQLGDYQELFEEKLDLFVRLMREDRVTWSGKYRTALNNVELRPRMPEGGIPTWIGIGGNPQSVLRAAKYQLPLMMAVIGGQPERFSRQATLYLKALEEFGHPELPIGQHSLGLVAATDDEAAERYWEGWHCMVTEAHASGGWYPPTRDRYAQEISSGALFVGSPDTVAKKIARIVRTNHLSRFDLKYDMIGMQKSWREDSIRLFGEEVAPRVRELLAAGTAADLGREKASQA